jgi:hypothetical protein
MGESSLPRAPDVLTPDEAEALRVMRAGPRADVLTDAEREAIARDSKAKGLRPKHMQAKLRKAIRESIARHKKAPVVVLAPPTAKYFGPPVWCLSHPLIFSLVISMQ